MHVDLLLRPPVQDRIRYLVGKIAVEKRLARIHLAAQANVAQQTLYKFLSKNELLGANAIMRLAHFILQNGYTYEDITRNAFAYVIKEEVK